MSATSTPTRAPLRCAAAVLATLLLAAAIAPAADLVDRVDEPLLVQYVSDRDIELRGRYVREMPLDAGGHALQFSGQFELRFGQRLMSAQNAVVWVEPRQDDDGRRYYEITAYLSGEAEIEEPGGTVTQDRVLYVSDIRTRGQIIKLHDASAVQDLAKLPLYQQASKARELITTATQAERLEATGGVIRGSQVREIGRPRAPQVIRYRLPKLEPAETEAGEPVLVATEGVYFSRSGGSERPLLEIRAASAVIFLTEAGAADAVAEPVDQAVGEIKRERDDQQDWRSRLSKSLRAAYLEGDVVLSLGDRFVRAERLFYDFEIEQALILDAVFRADLPDRQIPIYVRADELRQISARRFSAVSAKITTDEFYLPHYHVGAEKVEIYDRTPRDQQGDPLTDARGTFVIEHGTFNVGGFPIAYWPYSKGDFEAGDTLLRSFSAGYNSEFGVATETKWHLYNLLGLAKPPGHDATLRLDYFSDRGPAIGVDADYERENHFGLIRSYYIRDDGEDDLGPLRREQNELDDPDRGRFLWRHRHYLANDWEAIFELSYIDDDNFLETYEREEFWEGKEQETLVYFKRARGSEAITFLANWRILEWQTQTEHLPETTYRRVGDTLLDPVIMYHESRLGLLNRRVDDRLLFEERRFSNQGESGPTFRGDARQEFELPLKLGPVNLVPFATVRGTYWDQQPLDEGGLWRGLGVYGVRGGTMFHKVYDDVESDLLDIHRIRHIVKPDFAAWWSHSNTRSDQIYPFDEGVETIDDFYGATFGLRQTWQTQRGPADDRQTIDLLTFDLEAGFFGDAQDEQRGYANPLRPEDSRTRNYVAGETVYRLSDTTSLLHDFNIDVTDGEFDSHHAAVAVERSPRLSYLFGYRSVGDIDYKAVGGGFNYKLTEKHYVATRAYYDIDRNEIGEVAVAYVRKLPRWYVALTWEWDEVFDDVSVTLSIWPEGIPEWTLGSRRFTGLGTSTAIRP